MTPARALAELRLAVAMLTRLPVGRLDPAPPLSAAAWAFPLAGIVPGLAGGTIAWAAGLAGLAPLAAAMAALAAAALVTGGLHEDGLADLTDGLSGGRTRERRLEIMRDSRVGSHGALALILAVGLRAAALGALVQAGAAVVAAMLAAAVLSRAGLPVLMVLMPPARSQGLGTGAAAGLCRRRAGAAVLIGAALALALTGPAAALAALCAAGAALAAVGILAQRRLGGQTGDVLGAAQIAAETAVLLVLSAGG